MTRLVLTPVIVCLTFVSITSADEFKATGFFRLEQIGEVWWLITPGGERFISAGVNHVSYTADQSPALGYAPYGRATAEKYGSEKAWAEAVVPRLKSWGFNTIGGWSSTHTYEHNVACTPILNLGVRAGGDWLSGAFPDVFSEQFEQTVENVVKAECVPRRDDPMVLGYFTDNELKWGPDWRSPVGLFAGYWALPADSAGRRQAVELLRNYYDDDFSRFAEVWKPAGESWDTIIQKPTLNDVSPLVADSQQKLRQNKLLGMMPKQVVIGYLVLQYGTISRFQRSRDPDDGQEAWDEL